MRTCSKCKKDNIPATVVVDGKRRNLSKRKYCFVCSPFGLHNTVKLHDRGVLNGRDCICARCSKEYVYSRTRGGTSRLCASCCVVIARQNLKKRGIEYLGGKCVRCGYDKCVQAMAFHHLDPSTKLFHFSSSMVIGWDKLRDELDKCVILCTNCHIEEHNGM